MKFLRSMTYHVCRVAVAMLLVAAAGCSRKYHDSRLSEIALTVATSPDDALARLDSIDPRTLPTADRHFHELLTVKARDKAYITHTDDSLILTVIDWYSHNDDPALYTEALYYGGRVYADIGDLNTALRYFHLALDRLPEDTPDINLRANVLSQTGRLLDKLRLNSDAIPYLRESVEADILLCDTFNLAYDYQLLGAIYLYIDSFAMARHCLNMAYETARHLEDNDLAFMQGFLAIAAFREGKTDSALILMRTVPERVPLSQKDYFASHASDIYLEAGIIDTAYMYAFDTRGSSDLSYKVNSYYNLLRPEIRDYIDPDSLPAYMDQYLESVDRLRRYNQNEAAIQRNACYNYTVHEKKSERLTASLKTTRIWLAVTLLIIITLIPCVIIMYLYLRLKYSELIIVRNNLFYLNYRLENKNDLRLIAPSVQETPEDISSFTIMQPNETKAVIERDITNLINSIITLSKSSDKKPIDIITEDSLAIRSIIKSGNALKPSDPEWKEIIRFIIGISPDFFNYITKLSSGSTLNDRQIHIISLLRIGVQNNAIARILGIDPSTVTYNRKKICKILFRDKISIDQLGRVLRAI